MEKEQTNLSLRTDKLPEELRANYNSSTHKGSAAVENLKVAAALKLWCDRGYRTVGFGVPCDFGEKTVYVDVLARDADGMVGVECASSVNLGRLHRRIAQLHGCLPADSYLILIFPSDMEKFAKKGSRVG